MTFFDKIYQKLFSEKKDQILSQEVFKRSPKELKQFEQWLIKEKHRPLLDKIHHAYHLKLTDIKNEIPIVLFQSDYANGFAVRNNEQIRDQSFPFLMEFFKMKILQSGYRQSGSSQKIKSVDDHVLTVEKYYLKPPLQTEPPIDQLYGNIALELHYFNGMPNYLKLTASIYSDRMYQPHLDFMDLVAKLFAH